VALHQNTALIGHQGLLPADAYLNSVAERVGGSLNARLLHAPTLFWFFDYSSGRIDTLLYWTAFTGLCLAALVMVRGAANIPIMLVLWAIYHSIVNVGQRWLVIIALMMLIQFYSCFRCMPNMTLMEIVLKS